MRRELTIFFAAVFWASGACAEEHWPDFEPSPEQTEAARLAMQRPEPADSPNYPPHRADGAFMDWSRLTHFYTNPKFKLDDAGIPMVEYYGNFQHNPVTVAQFGLHVHALWLKEERSVEQITNVADRLLTMQGFDGAFRYAFSYRHHSIRKPFAPGWTSALAQGNALSFLARAYAVTGDERYLNAGNEALDFLVHDTRRGIRTTLAELDRSLDAYVFFDEYPSSPRTYTLNGFMFVLLGLYDWSEITGSHEARELFDAGVRTLEKITYLYDFDYAIAYDLSHLTIEGKGPFFIQGYHPIHLDLIQALAEISGSTKLAETATRWETFPRVTP